jgi:hypothetical protein
MSQHLTKIERELVEQILKQNPTHYEVLKEQIEHLTVSLRKPTGVGSYIYFSLPIEVKIADASLKIHLVFNGNIIVEGVPSGLGCVMLVKDGRMYYLELFTYGNESWDGNLEKVQIIPKKSN